MKHKYGISWADKYLGSSSIWKNQERQAMKFREEKAQTDHLEELLKRAGNGKFRNGNFREEKLMSGITERNTGIRKTDCVRGCREPRENGSMRNI